MESNNTSHRPDKTSSKPRYSKHESVKILEGIALDKLKERYPNNPYYPKPNYTDATSNGLTKCVLDYIGYNGFLAERINSTGFLKDNRKTYIDVLGYKRTIGSVQFIKSNTQTGTISSTIKGKKIIIQIKCSLTGSKTQSKGQKVRQEQIEAAGSIYLTVENFSQFYEWLNEFTKN